MRWVRHLKSIDSRLPGICGTARPLLATLAFGLLELGRGGEARQLPVSAGEIEAFARHLVERMVTAYESVTRTAETERKNELIRRIFVALAAGGMSKRDLYRQLGIDVAFCDELLYEMGLLGLVRTVDKKWERIEGVGLQAVPARRIS